MVRCGEGWVIKTAFDERNANREMRIELSIKRRVIVTHSYPTLAVHRRCKPVLVTAFPSSKVSIAFPITDMASASNSSITTQISASDVVVQRIYSFPRSTTTLVDLCRKTTIAVTAAAMYLVPDLVSVAGLRSVSLWEISIWEMDNEMGDGL